MVAILCDYNRPFIHLHSTLQSPLNFLFELDKNIASNWDLYLITILTILLGMIFYFRRPPQHVERDSPRSLETPTHTPQPAPTQSPATDTVNSVNSDQ